MDIETPASDSSMVTEDIDDPAIAEPEKEHHPAATRKFFAKIFRRDKDQNDKPPLVPDSSRSNLAIMETEETIVDLKPPPTPETPKSPAIAFEFTPLTPMRLNESSHQRNHSDSILYETPTSKGDVKLDINDEKAHEKENTGNTLGLRSLSLHSRRSIEHSIAIRTPPFHCAQPQPHQENRAVETDKELCDTNDNGKRESTASNEVVEIQEVEENNPREDVEQPPLTASESSQSLNLLSPQDSLLSLRTETTFESTVATDEEGTNHSSDPPGILPTPKNETKEEMDHVKKAEMMREELDALIDNIEATAEELKHGIPWINTTPQLSKKPPRKNSGSQSVSPAGSDFQIMVSAATSAPTPIMGGSEDNFENEYNSDHTPIHSKDDYSVPSVDSCKETPIRSNLTYAQLDATGSAEFVRSDPIRGITPQTSPVPLSKSESTSSIASSTGSEQNLAAAVIQSNTPRTRKILEWLDPRCRGTKTVSDTWPAPSMATNIRKTNTPERKLPTSQSIQQPEQGKNVAEWWVPRPSQLHSNSSSPASLPSMLGTASLNEVSDLESPRLSYPVLNYRFSEEESDIHSQSLQDQASDICSNGEVSPSLQSMLHNTYNINGENQQGTQQPKLASLAVSAGCPTDEAFTPTASKGTSTDVEVNRGIEPNATAQTDISPTNRIGSKSFDGAPRSSWWLRRCAVFFILVAIASAIAVPLCLKFLSMDHTENEVEINDDALPVLTETPTAVPTIHSSSLNSPSAKPVAVPPDDDVGDPTKQPSISPSNEDDIEYSWDDFRWNRIEMGEGVWRGDMAEGGPIWYFASSASDASSSLSGINLDVVNAADGSFHPYIIRAVEDYRASEAVVALRFSTVPYQSLCEPIPGRIKICSGKFGNTDWYGQTILLMRDNDIVSAAIQINTSKELSPRMLQHTLCHQLGHALGLQHSDGASCMQDIVGAVVDESAISNQLQHPSQADLDALVSLYGPAE